MKRALRKTEAEPKSLSTKPETNLQAKHTISDQALADWVVTTCLLYGTTVATAYQVAGLFVLGVRENRKGAKDNV